MNGIQSITDGCQVAPAIILPGYNVSKISTFKLTNLDLPYRDYKEWKWRQSIENSIDYGPRLLTESPKKVFEARINDHMHRFDSEKITKKSKTMLRTECKSTKISKKSQR
jgi:hypothetical protein